MPPRSSGSGRDDALNEGAGEDPCTKEGRGGSLTDMAGLASPEKRPDRHGEDLEELSEVRITELRAAVLRLRQEIAEHERAEEMLREREQRYRGMFENAVEGIFQTTPEGHFLSANPALARMYGFETPEELIAAVGDIKHDMYVDPVDRERLKGLYEKRSMVSGFQTRLYRRDRSILWVSMNARAVRNAQGAIEYYEGTVEDITHRKAAEEAVRKSEAKFRTLFENANDAIFLIRDDIFVDCNSKTLDVFHCTRDQIIGKPPYVFSPPLQPDGRDSKEKALEKICTSLTGHPQFFEWKHRRYDGTLFDAEVGLNALELGGEVVVQAIVRDVTGRKEMEESLQSRQEELTAIYENAPLIMLLVDGERRVCKTNRHTEDFVRASSTALAGRRAGEALGCVHALEDPRGCGFGTFCVQCPVRRAITETFETGRSFYQIEVYLQTTVEGEAREAAALVSTVRLNVREEPMVLVTIQNITERKLAEQKLERTNKRLENIIEFLPDATFIVNKDKKIVAWNRAIEAMTGVFKEDILGKDHGEAAVPFYGEPGSLIMDLIDSGAGELEGRYDFVERKDGVIYAEVFSPVLYGGRGAYIWVTASALPDADGDATGTIESIRDITERKRAEEAVKENERKYRTLFENANDAIILLKEDVMVDCNSRAADMFRCAKNELIGTTPYRFFSALQPDGRDSRQSGAKRIRAALGGNPQSFEWKHLRHDGTPFDAEVSLNAVELGEGVFLQAIIRDITERKQMEEKLHTMSVVDELTGLFNRRGFLTMSQQQLSLAERTKETMVLFFIDLDGMKWINDTLGHREGDKALIEVAEILRDTFRKSDIAGRMGGDEFAVLAIDGTGGEKEALRRLRESVDTRNGTGPRRYNLSLSVGLACFDPQSPVPLDDLISKADILMYEEKRAKYRGK